MTKAIAWRRGCAVLLFCTAAAATSAAQAFTKLVDFDGTDGQYPSSPLVQGANGNLYGTTTTGGDPLGGGTVFKVSAAGLLTTIHHFCTKTACPDGARPMGALVLATDGNYYGTNAAGESTYYGTVFKTTAAGALTTLYTFCPRNDGCPDGAIPYAGLVQASDGNFYGTTVGGGVKGYGTVFKITLAGALTTLHSFDSVNGAAPFAGLIQATDGSLYGTTKNGGDLTCNPPFGCGTVFKITLGGKLTVLHIFKPTDGVLPYAALVQATDGNFYGTTYNGGDLTCNGALGCGTVFKITPGGLLTKVHTFESTDGALPTPGLVQATDGNFYGMTSTGGDLTCNSPIGCGTVFEINLGGVLTTLHTFDSADGNDPYGALVQSTDGTFYGEAYGGGAYGYGTVFNLAMGLDPFVSLVRNPARVGQIFGVLGQGFIGATSVSINGIPANFSVRLDTVLTATVPAGATTGYVTVTTPSGTLTSNVPFHVIP